MLGERAWSARTGGNTEAWQKSGGRPSATLRRWSPCQRSPPCPPLLSASHRRCAASARDTPSRRGLLYQAGPLAGARLPVGAAGVPRDQAIRGEDGHRKQEVNIPEGAVQGCCAGFEHGVTGAMQGAAGRRPSSVWVRPVPGQPEAPPSVQPKPQHTTPHPAHAPCAAPIGSSLSSHGATFIGRRAGGYAGRRAGGEGKAGWGACMRMLAGGRCAARRRGRRCAPCTHPAQLFSAVCDHHVTLRSLRPVQVLRTQAWQPNFLPRGDRRRRPAWRLGSRRGGLASLEGTLHCARKHMRVRGSRRRAAPQAAGRAGAAPLQPSVAPALACAPWLAAVPPPFPPDAAPLCSACSPALPSPHCATAAGGPHRLALGRCQHARACSNGWVG